MRFSEPPTDIVVLFQSHCDAQPGSLMSKWFLMRLAGQQITGTHQIGIKLL